VYLGRNAGGEVVALGTHPDIVARLLSEEGPIDPVSVCDFLNTGTPCFPFTMHRNVQELRPGSGHFRWFQRGGAAIAREFAYWIPPTESHDLTDESELGDEFVQRWRAAVGDRCDGNALGVQLSGGLDSRLVLAAVPGEKPCVGLTLCDKLNREAVIARRAARCYGRDWVPLYRSEDYVAETAREATRFAGCEGEWHHAHAIGFAERIAELGIDRVFTGLLMDNNFKGYYSRDLARIPRWGGLLPARYQIAPVEYDNQISEFCRKHVRRDLVEESIERRRAFSAGHFARKRESAFEWLDGYPYSQSSDNTAWIVERRVMPLRLPLMDRRLLDLAFRIPLSVKVGGGFFSQAAARLLGPGSKIPNANDGVRPGSGHVSRLLQRGMRKLERKGRDVLSDLGIRLSVPHSWHDYQRFWTESPGLERIRQEEGENVRAFEGEVFNTNPRALLDLRGIPWRTGFRLIQLAVWKSVLSEY
jgi:asparagine synthetase B (glutamine-hydrolysing)